MTARPQELSAEKIAASLIKGLLTHGHGSFSVPREMSDDEIEAIYAETAKAGKRVGINL